MLNCQRYKEETPPLAWGRLGLPVARLVHDGNTPTRVGKTQTVLTQFGKTEKHPHSRGEDHTSASLGHSEVETPPLAWGRRLAGVEGMRDHGNTPTRVGKTDHSHRITTRSKKHPHSRGEDHRPRSNTVLHEETPPLAWGRLSVLFSRPLCEGNTPTRVGKTEWPRRRFAPWEKHPHSRGEDAALSSCTVARQETPPLAWGRPPRSVEGHVRVGNTPTRVGKTSTSRRRAARDWKHPHSRGEDGMPQRSLGLRPETPPLAWGRPYISHRVLLCVRNTPTRVGKTSPPDGTR